ncbi:MAG TPA: hypothetical protein PKM73_02750 [Verrucomicrobiota bacterium]|nr:hypothetical protein [Verrucomicrobiota bacterium]HNU49657.1 hypothetical protein [Verrucomicrobiota bacterium]
MLILYDKRESGFRAKELFDRQTARSKGELQFDLELFRFDVLAHRGAAEAAGVAASGADLIVIAWSQGGALPHIVRTWFETWGHSHARPCHALLALPVEQPTRHPATAQAVDALQDCAARHGVTFLCQWNLDTALAWTSFMSDLDQRAHAITPTLQGLIDRTRSETGAHWGINE